jgi:hypothetical protein
MKTPTEFDPRLDGAAGRVRMHAARSASNLDDVRDRARRRQRRQVTTIAAGLVAFAVAGGVFVAGRAPDAPAVGGVDTAEPTSSVATTGPTSSGVVGVDQPAPGGALVFDRLPDELADATGYRYVGAGSAELAPSARVQRRYTADVDAPERGPHLSLTVASSTQGNPPVIPPPEVDVQTVSVRGVTGWLYDDPSGDGRTVAFAADGVVFELTGVQVSDEELLRAADHTSLGDGGTDPSGTTAWPAEIDGVIGPAGLPAGVVERAVGVANESGGFTSFTSNSSTHTSVRWADALPPSDGDAMLSLGWVADDPDLLPLYRLGQGTVTDATVRGVPAFIVSRGEQRVTLVWFENGYRYSLGGFALAVDDVLAAADSLRPATDAEWTALTVEPG